MLRLSVLAPARATARRGRPRVLAGAVSAVLLAAALSGCTAARSGGGSLAQPAARTTTDPSAASSPTAAAVAPIKFSDCAKSFNISAVHIPAARLKQLSFSCGKVGVPLNYDSPGGKSIDVEVLRIHDSEQTKSLGSLLINPGGPGASGLTAPIVMAATISDTVLQHFDLIGFDPRGVGLSSPVRCVSAAEKDALYSLDPDLTTAAGLALAKAAVDQVADDCTASYGTALADYNTVFTAMDLDRIRIALGDAQLNYLGYSYGTELGAVYAHLYPAQIRVAVLDGAVDPTTDADPIAELGQQLTGFEAAFDQFAADCATRPACAELGDPRAVVTKLVAQANLIPIRSSNAGETRTASGGIVLQGVLAALYDQSSWPSLGQALIAAQQGDALGLFTLLDAYSERDSQGAYNNLFDANTAITCNDSPVSPSDALIQATAASWAIQFPMFGAWQATSLFSCQNWQPVRHRLPPASAAGSNPILVIGNIHDPATPYVGAQRLTAALTAGTLLTWNGEGHTAYLRGSRCIDTAVDDYLVQQTLPVAGTVCPA